jgi:AraC-like DNA-binding protein
VTYWSFSEYLNMIELRSQTWCVLQLSENEGLQVPHTDAVLFYAVLDGTARLSLGRDDTTQLNAGDIAIVTSGDGHALRGHPDAAVSSIDFLTNGGYVDTPITVALGSGPIVAQILCGRLKARWPGTRRPVGLPNMLATSRSGCPVDVGRIVQSAQGRGGSATLTRMATLIFTESFRNHPASAAIFRISGMREPVAEAIQIIQKHPFQNWTVALLARKVGMGRSSFATRFVADVGKTPMALVTEERMKLASAMLEQTDLKIADIADRIGYRSESAFSHRFAAHFGSTPGELRSRKRHVQSIN